MKILFIDLDGTIRQTKSGETLINDPYDQQPIKGALEMCDRYHKAGWYLLGVINQKGVMMGFKTLENMILEQKETLRIFPQLWKIYSCPDEGNSMITIYRDSNINRPIVTKNHDKAFFIKPVNFRKPNTGMIQYFTKTHNRIEQALFIGDRYEDEECAKNANIPFMWAQDWLKSEVNND